MPSGDTLAIFFPLQSEPPATVFATFDSRNGVMVADFDDTVDEHLEFAGFMPRFYSDLGITVTIGWMATDTTVGPDDCIWDVAFKSVSDDLDDLDSKAFASPQSVTSTEASASGEVKYETIAFTNGAQMDSIAAGEYFRMDVNRDASNVSDDLVGDAELVFVEIRET